MASSTCSAPLSSSCLPSLLAAQQQIQAQKSKPSLSQVRTQCRNQKKRHDDSREQVRQAVEFLKQSGLYPFIVKQIANKRQFTAAQIDAFMAMLNLNFPFGGWRWEMLAGASSIGAVLYAPYKEITPCLVFCATGKGFNLCSFHFDLNTTFEIKNGVM